MKKQEIPKRKHPRLKLYDYSQPGGYFITICTANRKCILSNISIAPTVPDNDTVGRGLAPAVPDSNTVGRGLAPAVPDGNTVGRGLAPAGINLSKWGEIVEKELLDLENAFPFLRLDKYVIMPNHIHAILIITAEAAGASPRPTIMDMICHFKSITTRKCKLLGFEGRLFQASFYDHIIRSGQDYDEINKYIEENPLNWYYDELYYDEK